MAPLGSGAPLKNAYRRSRYESGFQRILTGSHTANYSAVSTGREGVAWIKIR